MSRFKALHVTLKSALLFLKRLRGNLKSINFEANKMVNGYQITIIWHDNDLKISHKDGWEITKNNKMVRKN